MEKLRHTGIASELAAMADLTKQLSVLIRESQHSYVSLFCPHLPYLRSLISLFSRIAKNADGYAEENLLDAINAANIIRLRGPAGDQHWVSLLATYQQAAALAVATFDKHAFRTRNYLESLRLMDPNSLVAPGLKLPQSLPSLVLEFARVGTRSRVDPFFH